MTSVRSRTSPLSRSKTISSRLGVSVSGTKARFDASLASYLEVVERLRKVPWQRMEALIQKRLDSPAPSRNEFSKHSEDFAGVSFELLARFFPDVAGLRAACVHSPFAHYVSVLLGRTGVAVTWYCCGPPTSMASVRDMLEKYADRLTVHFVSAVAPAFPGASVGAFDLVLGDYTDHSHERATALFLAGGAALAEATRPERMLLFGLQPRSPKATSCLTVAWDVFFRAMEPVGWEVRKNSSRGIGLWWAALKPRGDGDKDKDNAWREQLRRAKAVADACVADEQGSFGQPSERLLTWAAESFDAATSYARETYKNMHELPRRQWLAKLRFFNDRLTLGNISSVKLYARGDALIKPTPYQAEGRDFRPSCHWGQLKLLLSEVEFLVHCRDELRALDDAVVVYAGAAPGEHIDLLIDMFPTVSRWLLFDSTRSTVRSPRARVFGPGKAGFVTDDTVRALRLRLLADGAPTVLFISDIRTRPTEETVADEMMDQARWGVHLRARAMLLKFRPPYVAADGSYHKVAAVKPVAFAMDDADLAALKRPATACMAASACMEGVFGGPGGDVLYLKGDIQLQLFAPPTSTEARLLVVPDKAGKYATAAYDPVLYESCMNDFNTYLRARGDAPLCLPSCPDTPDVLIPGHDDGWECRKYYAVAAAYLKGASALKGASKAKGSALSVVAARQGTIGSGGNGKGKAASEPAPELVMRLMREMEERLAASTNASLLACTMSTFAHRAADSHHDEAERSIIRLWTRLWRVRMADYATIMRVRLRKDGARIFGTKTTEQMLRELDAAVAQPSSGAKTRSKARVGASARPPPAARS
jgi:hypothetical protein